MTDSFIDQKERGAAVSGAIVFFLLGVFAFFSIVMVLLSAHTYKSTVNQSASNANARILHHYIINTVQSADAVDAVYTQETDGIKRLVILMDSVSGIEMNIYAYEGSLLELYKMEDDPFTPQYGEIIMPLACFQPSVNGHILSVGAEDVSGNTEEIIVYLNCLQGGEGS